LAYSVLTGEKLGGTEIAGAASRQPQCAGATACKLSDQRQLRGVAGAIDGSDQSAKAQIMSNYAAQGLSTDPTQNTALAAQLQMSTSRPSSRRRRSVSNC